MSGHIMDSEVFGHLWATDEVRSLFDDSGRTQGWLDVVAALATAQAELGLIPAEAAGPIAAQADVSRLDLAEVARRTRETGHSTLGLIQTLRATLPPEAEEWVYYGATVQDVTDSWTGGVQHDPGTIALRDLRAAEASTLELARTHRDTVMLGRTHAQPGLPVTFGFKAAVWAAEIRRHITRLVELRDRVSVGQLAGAVGSASFWGDRGEDLLKRFCELLDLAPPEMTWLTARDRIAEFVCFLAMASGTMAKIGNEVTNLQRAEIGEVRETFRPGTVGSITMPHKRNPELSEQLVTLGRIVRADADLALEGMVHEHERDGAAWKAEWAFLPEACMAAAAALHYGHELVANLDIDSDRMMANLDAQRGYVSSEPVMRELAGKVGKNTAHELLYAAAMEGVERGQSFDEALRDSPVDELLDQDERAALLAPDAALEGARRLVDRVLAAGEEARAGDPDWKR